MTRKTNLRLLAFLCAWNAVIPFPIGVRQLAEALKAPSFPDWAVQPAVDLGLAPLLLVSAWGLWHDTRWGWYGALFCISTGLSMTFALREMAAPALVGGIMVMLLYQVAPRPVRAGRPTTEQVVDRLARALGVSWESHPLSRIDEALRAGKKEEAARLYREYTGATWDQVDRDLADWENRVVEQKLQFLAREVEARSNPGPSGASAGPA